jgi:hypothetical protein
VFCPLPPWRWGNWGLCMKSPVPNLPAGTQSRWTVNPKSLTPESTLSAITKWPTTLSIHLIFERLTSFKHRRKASKGPGLLACLGAQLKMTQSSQFGAALLTSPIPIKFYNCFWKNHFNKGPKLAWAASVMDHTQQRRLLTCPCFKGDWEKLGFTKWGLWWLHFDLKIAATH